MCVLGGIMSQPREAYALVSEFLREQHFYLNGHGLAYRVMGELYNRGIPPDAIALIDELRSRELLAQVGGVGVVMGMLQSVPTSANVEHHARIVVEKWRGRQIIHDCTKAIQRSYEQRDTPDEILELAIQSLGRIRDTKAQPEDAATLADLAQDEGKRLIESGSTGHMVESVTTGFRWLDEAMGGGFQDDDLVTMGARTNTGKSKISLYMLAAAARGGARVGIISLDMGWARLRNYIIPAFNNVYRPDAMVTPKQLFSLEECGEMRDARIWDVCSKLDPDRRCYVITDPRTFTMQSIAGYVRILADRGCKLILLDQVQNIGGWDRGASDRGEYHAIFNELKMLPRRHHLALVVLHQINREGSDRPQIRNLQDSGVVEQFSDFVVLLHDYQSTLISTHGGFKMKGERAVPPLKGDLDTMLCEPQRRRIISVHLAKSRSSVVIRKDCYFDYATGVAG